MFWLTGILGVVIGLLIHIIIKISNGNDGYRKELEEVVQSKKDQAKKLNEQMDELTRRNHEQTEAAIRLVAQHDADKAEWERQLTTVKDELSRVRQTSIATVEHHKTETAQHQQAMENLLATMTEKNLEIDQLTRQKQEFDRTIEGWKFKLSKEEKEVSRLRDVVAGYQKQRDELTQQIQNARVLEKNLNGLIQTGRKLEEQLQDKIDEQRDTISNLNLKILELENAIATMEAASVNFVTKDYANELEEGRILWQKRYEDLLKELREWFGPFLKAKENFLIPF